MTKRQMPSAQASTEHRAKPHQAEHEAIGDKTATDNLENLN
jgi:hypothetical protein